MWQQWMNTLLGFWVVALAFLGMSSETQTWTLALTGLVIAALGIWGALQNEDVTEYRERMV